jgi:hypothetical protein
VEAESDVFDDHDAFVLERDDLDNGAVRWTQPSDGVAIHRASRIVTGFAALLFAGGVGVLFCSPWLDNDTVIRMMSTAWIVAIIMALAAAHWRTIAGEPSVVEAGPEGISLFNPAQLWGRTQRWRAERIRKLVIRRHTVALTGRQVATLSVRTRWRQHVIFDSLEIPEIETVAGRISTMTGVPVSS